MTRAAPPRGRIAIVIGAVPEAGPGVGPGTACGPARGPELGLHAGIAAAVARALSGAGAGVVLAGPEGPALAALAAGINAAGGQAVAVPADVADPVSVRRLVEQTLGAFGRLDAAVNHPVNHAGTRAVSVAMASQIPAMRRSGAGGRIVNVTPSAGPRAAATIDLTRAAARDHAGSGVLINAVAVGPGAGAEEVAAAVLRLCLDDATPATGETWHVPHHRP
ncbi:SDR family oxidoreductase [Nonomuraea rubra]|uniref:SDR family oxidoreductase n=1 Tax=Nonomuraea rubra TaxID=46180 RepID=UPI0033DF209B